MSQKLREEDRSRRRQSADKAGQIKAERGPLGLASRRSLETWRGVVSVRSKYKNLMRFQE